jgi:cytochrome c-type biogenesis protein CcmH/NrfF
MTATATEPADPPRDGHPARKWGPWIVLVLIAAVVLGIGLQRDSGKPNMDARVEHIAAQVRCPVCNGETAAQSQAAASVAIRAQIRTDLQNGESQDQILSSLVASYGPSILEKPQAKGIGLLVWVVPVIALLLGAAGVVLVVRRWRTGGARPVAVGDEGDEPEPAGTPDQAAPARPGPPRAEVPQPDGPPAGEEGEPAGPPVGEALESVGPAAVADEPAGVEPAVPAALEDDTGAVAPAGPAAAVGPDGQVASSRRGRRRTRVIVAGAGVLLIAGGASWAVAASSGTRLPGQEITGQSLSSETVAAAIETATADEDRNDPVDALKLYQKVLKSDPNQVQALAGEGWLLAQTGQPALLKQGLAMLVQAEQIQPTYAASHLYRGLAFLGEADYGDAVPEFQWYLAHSPDPKLVDSVKAALTKAQQNLAAISSASSATSNPSASTVPATSPTTGRSGG